MSSKIASTFAPYRQLGTASEEPPVFGIIPYIDVKAHRCNLPKKRLVFFPHLHYLDWLYLKLTKVIPADALRYYAFRNGDLFRCSCGKVYRYRLWDGSNGGLALVRGCVHRCTTFCSYWTEATIEDWKELGGKEG